MSELNAEERRHAELRAGVEQVLATRHVTEYHAHVCPCCSAFRALLSDTTTCPHTGQPVKTCICMVHDPDGAHYRARLHRVHEDELLEDYEPRVLGGELDG